MTTNAFLFMWDEMGIESIVPISQYEDIDMLNTFNILADKPVQRNPLTSIIQHMVLRARINGQRSYEIYAIDCEDSYTEEFWEEMWTNSPQECADLIRERGTKIYSNYIKLKPVIT
jgi:hypothetical protein